MVEWKSYTDKYGYEWLYTNVEMLCGLMMCGDCKLYGTCAMKGEEDSCYEYNEKLEELKKEGIK